MAAVWNGIWLAEREHFIFKVDVQISKHKESDKGQIDMARWFVWSISKTAACTRCSWSEFIKSGPGKNHNRVLGQSRLTDADEEPRVHVVTVAQTAEEDAELF